MSFSLNARRGVGTWQNENVIKPKWYGCGYGRVRVDVKKVRYVNVTATGYFKINEYVNVTGKG